MNAKSIEECVRSQIGDEWHTTNAHSVDLRKALVHPKLIKVIDRQVQNEKLHDRPVDVWFVLIEDPKEGTGYRIVATSDGSMFGLAIDGFPSDEHLVLCGWYGTFLDAFHGM